MANEFYSPVYETEAKKRSPVPDLRKTIHWEPVHAEHYYNVILTLEE
jgi:hypothetical protein